MITDGLFTSNTAEWATPQAFFDELNREFHFTVEGIKKIVKIADGLLDDPKVRIAIQNHSEEEYYQRVLDEYNKDVSKGKTQF